MYEFSCDWNYRPDHCIYENNCPMAEFDGIKILHGCRSAFHNDKYPEFKSIYQIINQWKFESNLKSSLLTKIKLNLKNFSLTNCGKSHEIFTKHLSKEISSYDYSLKSLYHLALILNTNWNFIDQSLILLKSLRVFSGKKTHQMHLHIIVSDNNTRNYFSKQVKNKTSKLNQ
jgi:hypothetical protein